MYTLQKLQEAIKKTDLSQIIKILTKNPEFLRSINQSNATLLHWIAGDQDNEDIKDPKEIVKFLLNYYDIDINQRAHCDVTALHEAVTNEKIAILELLLEKGAKITKNVDGWTALHLAAIHNYTPMVKLLLNYGADPYAKTNDGDTPAHLAAAENEDASTFNLLIENVANPGALLLIEDELQETPFNIALTRTEFLVSEKKYYIKIALLANPTLEMPNIISNNPTLLAAWYVYTAELRTMQAKQIRGTTLTLCDLAKTIDLDKLPKDSIEKINLEYLVTVTNHFPAYKSFLISNIVKLKFIKNFITEKIADSFYSFYDIYHEKSEYQLEIIFSNERLKHAVNTYLVNIDSNFSIPVAYKEKIKNTLEQNSFVGIQRNFLNTLKNLNKSAEHRESLPKEIKSKILPYLSTEQLNRLSNSLTEPNIAIASTSKYGLTNPFLFKRKLSHSDPEEEKLPRLTKN